MIMTGTAELLRLLAANDERCVRGVLSPTLSNETGLDGGTRALVRLSALLATHADAVSVRCAVERVSTAGVGDSALVRVLINVALAAGAAQPVLGARRLAQAIDLDVDDRDPA